MATKFKFAANDALKVINGPLFSELSMHCFNEPTRTKAHLFSVGGRYGKQFGIILGNTDVATGIHPAKQTRILFEKCVLPSIQGIKPCSSPYQGSRIKNNQDSKIAAPNQTSCIVADETALKALLKWYAGVSSIDK